MSYSGSRLLNGSLLGSTTLRGGSTTYATSTEPRYSSSGVSTSYLTQLLPTNIPQSSASYSSSGFAYGSSSRRGYGNGSGSIIGSSGSSSAYGRASSGSDYGRASSGSDYGRASTGSAWQPSARSRSPSSGGTSRLGSMNSRTSASRPMAKSAASSAEPESVVTFGNLSLRARPESQLSRSYHFSSGLGDSGSNGWQRDHSGASRLRQQPSDRISMTASMTASLLPAYSASQPEHDAPATESRHTAADRVASGSGGGGSHLSSSDSSLMGGYRRPASPRLPATAARSSGGDSSRQPRSGAAGGDSGLWSDRLSSTAVDVVVEGAARDLGCDAAKVRLTGQNGDIGLHNLGNTCFMSSVIQCLSSTRLLVQYIMQNGHEVDLAKAAAVAAEAPGTAIKHGKLHDSLMEEFAKLIQSLWQGGRSPAVYPDEFKFRMQAYAPSFGGYSQHDAQEFLQHLLQGLHKDINLATLHAGVPKAPQSLTGSGNDLQGCSVQAATRSSSAQNVQLEPVEEKSLPLARSVIEEQKQENCWRIYRAAEDSKIVDLFAGQLRSTLTCTSCGYSSMTFEPFWDLSLPIPVLDDRGPHAKVSLRHCLEAFVDEEQLDGDEQPVCDSCKVRTVCSKSLSIVRFPQVLVLHLKRFTGERYRTKLATEVEFPERGLDLSVCCPKGTPCCLYDLYAVINHTGTVYSGHYTALCKHPVSGAWRRFDDHRVSPISPLGLASSGAYVLFYEAKKDATFQSSL